MTVPEPREPAPPPVTGGPRGHLRGHHIFWSLIAGLVIVGVAITAAWLLSARPDPSDHDAWADLIRSAVLAAGAIAAVPAGYVAYRKQQTTEAERHDTLSKEQRRQAELVEANTRADAKDYRDRYAAASGQLGSDKAAIRLAGVYALAQLADEWGRTEPDQRQVCINVLCAYLRMPWPTPTATTPTRTTGSAGRRLAGHTAPPAAQPSANPREVAEETQVRATILRVAADHLDRSRDPVTAWWSNNFDLRGANRLPQCVFFTSRFDGVFDARGATFSQDAQFMLSTFSGITLFEGATFSGDAGFGGALFSGATEFQDATFSGHAGFDQAKFNTNARFEAVTFTGTANFEGTTFSGDARFKSATFSQDARFDYARFAGDARFERATFYQDVGFEHATFSGDADFRNMTIEGNAMFGRATFSKSAWFKYATFVGDTTFDGATFFGDAGFDGATFFGDAVFGGATVSQAASFGTTEVSTVLGMVERPDGTLHPGTTSLRPLERALFPEGRAST